MRAAVALLLAGCASDPGLMAAYPRYEGVPISVCATAYEGADGTARRVVSGAVHTINARLGLAVYALDPDGLYCDVSVTIGAPAELGWLDAGGDAVLSATHCAIRTSNVFGEVLGLVVQHELGHCLGLAHDDWNGSIMRRFQSETPPRAFPPRITDGDRALLRRLYGVP